MAQEQAQVREIAENIRLSRPPKGVVALVPYYLKVPARLTDVSLDDLEWPIGRPEGLVGKTVGDLGPNDHLFTYPGVWLYLGKLRGLKAKISLLIVEPSSIHKIQMWLAKRFHRRFHRVLSCNAALLAAIPNGQYFVFGSTWVPDWRDKDVTKTKMLSLITSSKRRLAGHKLRHAVVTDLQAQGINADIMGGGFQWFDDKAEGLAPYRYSIVIENTREAGYFTEKLLDAFLLNTVPIYWGAPDITDFFAPEGMVICETKAQIVAAAKAVSEADFDTRQSALAANRKVAIRYADMLRNAARLIEATL